MNIWQFIFYLGVINIIFGFVWKWVLVFPAALLFGLLRFDDGMKLVKTFGTYLLVSLTVLFTLTAVGSNPNSFRLIFYPFMGICVLFMCFGVHAYEQRIQAQMTMDRQDIENNSDFDGILMIGAIVFYLIALFVPKVATNPIVEWMFRTIQRIYDLPVIGWLIGMGGALWLCGMVLYSVATIGVVVAGIAGKFRKKGKQKVVVVGSASEGARDKT